MTDTVSAETIKFASNPFLATKLSFVNSFAALCEAVGADVGEVILGLGQDRRIGFDFLRPGPGWGGSCLPKDTRALLTMADEAGFDFALLRAALAANESQLDRVERQVVDLATGAGPTTRRGGARTSPWPAGCSAGRRAWASRTASGAPSSISAACWARQPAGGRPADRAPPPAHPGAAGRRACATSCATDSRSRGSPSRPTVAAVLDVCEPEPGPAAVTRRLPRAERPAAAPGEAAVTGEAKTQGAAAPAGGASAAHGGSARVAAVVVDYDAGPVLAECVRSLEAEGVEQTVVVENGTAGAAEAAMGPAGRGVPVVATGRNVGYGAGANRGIAATGASELVLVCNPDLRLHPGAVATLVAALDAHPDWAIVGPRILDERGAVYPSVRRFPSVVDAAGHALLALAWPDNPFTRRYRPTDGGGDRPRPADWVSGACFLARRAALEQLGGFDEGYFMFAEDMDLCWRARRAGWSVGVEPGAVVTHAEGVTRRRRPYRMLLAHHRSAMRFEARTATGWRRLALAPAAVVLGVRLVLAFADQLLRRRGER